MKKQDFKRLNDKIKLKKIHIYTRKLYFYTLSILCQRCDNLCQNGW